jgi:hypothetical protein
MKEKAYEFYQPSKSLYNTVEAAYYDHFETRAF